MIKAMTTVNWSSILLAAIVAWIFGAVYYGLLGKFWLAAQGKTMESMKLENAGKSALANAAPFILSFVAEILMAWALYGVLTHMGMFAFRAGMIAGALCWLGFVLTTVAVLFAFSASGQGFANSYPQRPPADPAVVARGKALFGVQCAFCHGEDARGGDVGPNLIR